MDAIEQRCPWSTGSELYQHYHDFEWGRPVRDEQKMFEFLTLDLSSGFKLDYHSQKTREFSGGISPVQY